VHVKLNTFPFIFLTNVFTEIIFGPLTLAIAHRSKSSNLKSRCLITATQSFFEGEEKVIDHLGKDEVRLPFCRKLTLDPLCLSRSAIMKKKIIKNKDLNSIVRKQ
jgi:hypothetical protein